MSREIRRVPLDFNFPLGDTWTGYLMPDHLRLPQCSACAGSGTTATGHWISAVSMLLLQLGEDVAAQEQGRRLHPYLATLMNRPDQPTAARPGPDAAEFTAGLAGRAPRGAFGHDAIDQWATTEKLLAAAGLPKDWAHCPTCKGNGYVATPEQQAAHDTWQPTEPPPGEGWQLWQTVSEGGPVSPVCATPEELADWIISTGNDMHGAQTPRDSLIRWIVDEGASAGSSAMVPGRGMVSGVELAATAGDLQ